MPDIPTTGPSAPWTNPGETSETYDGHCHCGEIKFTVKLSPPLHAKEGYTERWSVVQCNCSICARNGYLLVHPYQRDFGWTKGQDKLKKYYFGRKAVPHWFCEQCGSSMGVDISALGDLNGGQRYGINVRMLKDVDLDTLQYKKVDGYNKLPPKYSVS